ncbi:MAG: ABC transporter ATP-binding protein [Opitutales bacterium]
MSPPSESAQQPATLRGFIWTQRGHLRTFLFWRFLSLLAITPFPILSQKIVDEAIPGDDLFGLFYYTLLSFLLLALHFLTMKVAVGHLATQSQEIFRKLRARIFHKLNFMHFGFLDSVQTGRLLSKYAFDTNNIEATVIQIVTAVLPQLLRSTLLILALAFINLWLLLIVLMSLPVILFVRVFFFEKVKENNYNVRLAREKMTGQANEFISAIKLVRGFGQEQQVGDQMSSVSSDYSSRRISQMQINQSLGYMLFSIVTALSLFAVGFCGWLVIEDKMTIGALFALVGALPVCLSPINMVTEFSMQYLLGSESYRSIKELLESAYVEKWDGKRSLDGMRGEIEFQNISFGYDKEQEKRAIHRFSTRIAPGEHVAFVGHSGSGKSTLVSLMLGFYAPLEGEIRIDGVPQKQLAIREFRQQCAIVMQDNLLLSGTILDNIRFGRPTASDDQVREAARQANALGFIEALPDGFFTKVGERGVSLSGGERQRIAIARALLRDPRILILDEATSALDYKSEKSVQAAIDYLARGRTTITIAHRLSTIRSADRIIVLDKGRCLAAGTWDELAARDGVFKELLKAQS